MTERAPQSPPPDWDLTAISDVLPATAELRPDPMLGNGVRFHVGDLPGTDLELFPSAGVVRIATPDVHIALVRQQPPAIATSGIVFARTSESGGSRLTIFPDGAVALALTPGADQEHAAAAPEQPGDEPIPPKRAIDRVLPSKPVADNAVPSDDPSSEQSDVAGEEPEEQRRIQLRGRLGAAPRFRTTRNEVLIGRFPLAVHLPESDTTVWHRVVAFGDRATRLQTEALRKGDLVSVVGYEHERAFTDKEGNDRREVEIFAAVVKRS